MTDYDFEITEVSTLEDIFPQKRDCLKELKVNINGHFDSDRLIFSDELFKLCGRSDM